MPFDADPLRRFEEYKIRRLTQFDINGGHSEQRVAPRSPYTSSNRY